MKTPDYQDADIILRLYDLRREAVMRESRSVMTGKFWPKTYEDFIALTKPEHPHNAAYRQVTSFWEMAYSFARHGIVNADFMAENAGEGIFVFAKIAPFVTRYRSEVSPTAFTNVEWLTQNSKVGHEKFELLKQRVAQMGATK